MPVETKSWPPKTPDAVLDYIYTIPVDEGDSITSHSVVILAGSITKDSDSRTDADVMVTLSGGVDGETNVFQIAWITAAGREDDAIVTLHVVGLENFEPRIAELRAMFPAFETVPDATIAFWLRKSDVSIAHWPADDQNDAALYLAAHNMASLGLGKGTAPAGVTSFKSGTFSVTMSDKAASATGYASTIYGRQYLAMCQRIFGGVRLVRTSDHV
mgnify:CR=1 FL=1